MKKKLLIFVLAAFAAVLLLHGMAFAQPDYETQDAQIEIKGNTINIVGNGKNNVIKWSSFDVAEDQTVQFDDKNYLNIIADDKASQIFGAIEGGENIYLVNPNGVIFGSESSVNVGNLYVSARSIFDTDINSFKNEEPMLSSAPDDIAGNIINLGKVYAGSVLFEGDNVTLTNNIETTPSGDGICARGNSVRFASACENGAGTVNNTQFKENGLPDLLSDFTENNKASFTDLNGTALTPDKYWILRNVYELQNMQNDLTANYLLADDIDAKVTSGWSDSGGFNVFGFGDNSFVGRFDGLNYKITDLHINISGGISGGVSGGISSNSNIINLDIPGIKDNSESVNSMSHKDGKLYVTALEKSLLFIAGYDKDGVLTAFQKYEIPSGLVNGEYDFKEGERAFLWKENLEPLCESEAY